MAAYSVFKRVKRQGRRFHVAKSTGRTTVVGTVGWLGKLCRPRRMWGTRAAQKPKPLRGGSSYRRRTSDVERYQLTRIDLSTRHSRLCRCPSGQKAPAPPTLGAAPTPGGPQITDYWTSQRRSIVRPASPSRP